MNSINIFLCYLLAVNLAGFLLFGMDKSRARRHRWRIPEKTLFAVALLDDFKLERNVASRSFSYLKTIFKYGTKK